LKVGVFVHPNRPKIPLNKIVRAIQSNGVSYSNKDPDVAVVVGGDGTFGYYGRTLRIPMLFVGSNKKDILGSKAKLAEISFKDLSIAMADIKHGNYTLERRRMFSVFLKNKSNHGFTNKAPVVDVLTDIYIERGIFSGCIRYRLSIAINKTEIQNHHLPRKFKEYGIGNGVIICTSFGAPGYYSYPDRINMFSCKTNNKDIHIPINTDYENLRPFDNGRIGICHILPSFLARKVGVDEQVENKNKKTQLLQGSCMRYTIPYESTIKIDFPRNSHARLYGTTRNSRGLVIKDSNQIIIRPSRRTAEVIRLC
jgi:NAD+ kinase